MFDSPRHYQTDNSTHGDQAMFNENWKTRKTTDAQQTYAETLSRFNDDQLEDEYIATMLEIAKVYTHIKELPMHEQPTAEAQSRPTLDQLALSLQQILTEANSRRQWPIPVNNTLPETLPSTSLKTYRELVNAMDEVEIESELQSCQEAVDGLREQIGDIQAEIRSGIRSGTGLDDMYEHLKTLEENLQAVRDEIELRQQTAREAERENDRAAAAQRSREDSIKDWLWETGDLAEAIRTAMSLTLMLASQLPTEGRYQYEGWRYEPLTDKAQSAETYLMMGYQLLRDAVTEVERAVRVADTMRGMLTDTQKPDVKTVRSDDIPF